MQSSLKKIFILSTILLIAGFIFSRPVSAQNANCNVIDADIRHNITNVLDPSGDEDGDGETNFQEEFFVDGNPPLVYLDIKTLGCIDTDDVYDMQLSLTETDIPPVIDPNDNVDDIIELDDWEINVEDNNDFTVVYLAGEDECGGGGEPDCQYHIETDDGNSSNDPWSGLWYSCDVTCEEDWAYIGMIPYGQNHPQDTAGNNTNTNTSLGTLASDAYLAPLPGLEGQPGTLNGFLEGLFQVLIVVAGLLAMIMLVVGAITYLSSDAFSGKTEGKDMMLSAVFGLILALGAWVIINAINPNLASNLGITIPVARLSMLEGDSAVYSPGATSSEGGTITGFSLPTDIGLYCPLSGGSGQVPAIIDSFVGKVAYRWGGKGGPLPAGQNYPLSPFETENPFKCTDDTGAQVPCNTFCPSGNACLDCSGFTNHVRKCAGLPYFATGTYGMTQEASAETVEMNTLNATGTQIGSYVLVPGDILVWNGHVVIYYGNGKIAESSGGTQGRAKNGNVNLSSIKKYKNKITHIIKVQ